MVDSIDVIPTPTSALVRQCRGINASRTPCLALPMSGSDYCFTHDPNIVEQRQEAHRRGGANSRAVSPEVQEDWKDIRIKTPADLQRFLSKVLNLTASGQIPSHCANALGVLSNAWSKCYEVAELSDRVSELEEILEETKQ